MFCMRVDYHVYEEERESLF